LGIKPIIWNSLNDSAGCKRAFVDMNDFEARFLPTVSAFYDHAINDVSRSIETRL
jgi:hypothetical protein